MPKPDQRAGGRRAGSGRVLTAEVCGDRVYAALLEARPAGLTFKQLMKATNLSAHHTRKGLNYAKDVLALANATPMTWTYGEGFRLPQDPAEWIMAEVGDLSKRLNGIVRATKQMFAPHAAARPDDDFAHEALDFIVGMKAGLNGIIRSGEARLRS
jgi:hypothetical protein